MKRWLLFFATLLLLPGCFKLSHDANNIYARIDLPGTNADGTPIDDLFEMEMVLLIDGKEFRKTYRAEPVTGATTIYDTIAMPATSYSRIDGVVYAWDFSGNRSVASNTSSVLGTKVATAPAPIPSPSPSPL